VHADSFPTLPGAHFARDEGMELDPAHRVDGDAEARERRARELPSAEVGGRDDGAPSARERLIEELRAVELERRPPRRVGHGGSGQVFDPRELQVLEHALRDPLPRGRIGELWMSRGADRGQVFEDGISPSGQETVLNRRDRPGGSPMELR
jgi:hypothetical protein